MLVDLCIKTGTRFSHEDKRLFEISEVKITRVDCTCKLDIVLARTVNILTLNKLVKLMKLWARLFKASLA